MDAGEIEHDKALVAELMSAGYDAPYIALVLGRPESYVEHLTTEADRAAHAIKGDADG